MAENQTLTWEELNRLYQRQQEGIDRRRAVQSNPTILIEVSREVGGETIVSRRQLSYVEWKSAKVPLADYVIQQCLCRLETEARIRSGSEDHNG